MAQGQWGHSVLSIGGCDGVSAIQRAELIGIQPTGTMPHALVLVLSSTVEATRAFHEAIDPAVRRVSLIDTFQDEKFAALEVAAATGENLFAVRLDTPASRRGDFYRLTLVRSYQSTGNSG